MPITFRGAAFAGAALAVLASPAVAQADTVQPGPAVRAVPTASLWDPQTGSSSLSSNVTAASACLVETLMQSLSGGPALNCVNGAG